MPNRSIAHHFLARPFPGLTSSLRPYHSPAPERKDRARAGSARRTLPREMGVRAAAKPWTTSRAVADYVPERRNRYADKDFILSPISPCRELRKGARR